jgi:hypothetical protein
MEGRTGKAFQLDSLLSRAINGLQLGNETFQVPAEGFELVRKSFLLQEVIPPVNNFIHQRLQKSAPGVPLCESFLANM